MTPSIPTIGLVLAGGRGSRLGGSQPKPLVTLGGRPLVQHVLDRLSPQVDDILISAAASVGLESFGPVVADEGDAFQGPAAGIAAAMHHLATRFADRPFVLVTVAADTPFFPRDLVRRLVIPSTTEIVRVATWRGRWVPTFACWPSGAALRLRTVANRSLRSVIADGPFEDAAFADSDEAPGLDPFFNINTTDDLRRARQHVGDEFA